MPLDEKDYNEAWSRMRDIIDTPEEPIADGLANFFNRYVYNPAKAALTSGAIAAGDINNQFYKTQTADQLYNTYKDLLEEYPISSALGRGAIFDLYSLLGGPLKPLVEGALSYPAEKRQLEREEAKNIEDNAMIAAYINGITSLNPFGNTMNMIRKAINSSGKNIIGDKITDIIQKK